jgi:hypothetical protein
MLDSLKDFKETLSERLKSPFIGSFMITWSLYHWRIYLFLLYSENNIKLQERVDKIASYLGLQNFKTLILYPILLTLCLLIVYSLLNAIGLAIKLSYENWISPFIQKCLNNPNIIEKSKYEKLKRQYSAVKKELDEITDKSISTEKSLKELETNFTGFRNKAFEGELHQEITALWAKDVFWENYYKYPDGSTGREIFTCEKDGFKFEDGTLIKLENIRTTRDGKFLTFDKVVDGKTMNNSLVRDNQGNYYGIENNNIIINYRKLLNPHIVIKSALYGANDKFVDVTQKVSELATSNLEIPANNEFWGDPIPGVPKTLEIKYTLNGATKELQIKEGNSEIINS